MNQEKKRLLLQIRDYLQSKKVKKINLLEICEALDCQLNDITKWASTPDELLQCILDLKSTELKNVLNFEKYEGENAIDSMVISGQEIYERFEQLSPAKYVFIRDLNPELYQSCQDIKFELIENHLSNNLDKGIETKEYKANIDKEKIINKYIKRIKDIHSREYLNSEHFTFSNIFSNIFEDYLEEVATDENWNYFRKRKQFYEAISFGNR
ncbi:hypothetical protein [Carboxylicivirga marina]|uniref:HTH cro/C1-type domain-containing protein n=1 Tax=Carboxylicivirga marina TaxID=2800988 RepID=A0ABS1HLT0_9BACT|nr:hypothetical protein [Carboxylicivirga marina]MBK3518497.1 hypothetical protein [Carboxylicivirga marina]